MVTSSAGTNSKDSSPIGRLLQDPEAPATGEASVPWVQPQAGLTNRLIAFARSFAFRKQVRSVSIAGGTYKSRRCVHVRQDTNDCVSALSELRRRGQRRDIKAREEAQRIRSKRE